MEIAKNKEAYQQKKEELVQEALNRMIEKFPQLAGKIKGLSNVLIASQWLMGSGGLPTAAAMGKFVAQRIVDAKR